MLLLIMAILCIPLACVKKEKIGVIYILHGGMDEYKPQFLWDASVHQFSFDQNHPVYTMIIWNSAWWPTVLASEESVKFLGKYAFEYERIGGTDPFQKLSDKQLSDMKAALNKNREGLKFEVEFASWMAGDRPGNYPYPRFLYNGPGGKPDKCTYCGEGEAGGPWAGCDPERYNIDGPVERLLKKGVSRIIAIDMAVGGVRFYKPFDVVQMTKRAMKDYDNGTGTTVPLLWVNDYGNVMERS